jgi:hypothetical protein
MIKPNLNYNFMIYMLFSPQGKEQLGDRRNDGESNCNSGDGTGQMAQTWMFMMIMMIFYLDTLFFFPSTCYNFD